MSGNVNCLCLCVYMFSLFFAFSWAVFGGCSASRSSLHVSGTRRSLLFLHVLGPLSCSTPESRSFACLLRPRFWVICNWSGDRSARLVPCFCSCFVRLSCCCVIVVRDLCFVFCLVVGVAVCFESDVWWESVGGSPFFGLLLAKCVCSGLQVLQHALFASSVSRPLVCCLSSCPIRYYLILVLLVVNVRAHVHFRILGHRLFPYLQCSGSSLLLARFSPRPF